MSAPVVTVFAGTTARDIESAQQMQLADLERMVRTAKPASAKENLAMLKLARFGERRSGAGMLRHDENILEVSGVEGDYDGGEMSMAEAAALLREAGVQALLYTTASHTPAKPRWRVLCPFDMPLMDKQELHQSRAHWVGVLNAILGGVLKSESFALSQSFFFGHVAGLAYPETALVDGLCIDQLPNPPEPRFPPKGNGAARHGPGRDGSRSGDLWRRVRDAVWDGLDDTAIHAKYDSHPHAADQHNPSRAVQACIDKWRAKERPPISDGPTAELLALDEMLERLVFISQGPLVIDRNNPARKWRLTEFHTRFAATGSRTREWLTHAQRLTADELDFDPSQPRFYEHRGQWVYNMWSAPGWRSTDVTLASPFLEHVDFLIEDETLRNEFLDWLAAVAQQPGTRPHFHYLMMAQTQGIGRSWLADLLVALWSEQYVTDTDLAKVISKQFNSELSCKLIVVIHETKAPAGEQFAYRDRLKSLLTDSRITINEKNLPVWVEKFCARLLMFTNNQNALPVTEADRRVCVIQNPATPRSSEYYTRLYETLRDRDFLAAVWTLLKTRNLSRYNPGAIARVTTAKERMADDNRTEEQRMAITFARTAPFDCILATDLVEVLVSTDGVESKRDRNLRIIAVIRALQDIGIGTADRKIWVRGQPRNVWILRSADSWRSASAAKLREAVQGSRVELEKHHWKVVTALEAWTKGELSMSVPNKAEFDPGP